MRGLVEGGGRPPACGYFRLLSLMEKACSGLGDLHWRPSLVSSAFAFESPWAAEALSCHGDESFDATEPAGLISRRDSQPPTVRRDTCPVSTGARPRAERGLRLAAVARPAAQRDFPREGLHRAVAEGRPAPPVGREGGHRLLLRVGLQGKALHDGQHQ